MENIDITMTLKKLIRQSEFLWHVFAILFQIGAFVPLWRSSIRGEVEPSEGDIVIRILLVVVYGISLAILIFYIPRLLKIFTQTPLLWVIVGWSLISFLWSSYPELAFRRAVAALFATLYAIVLYFRFSFKEILRILFYSFLIILVGSIVMIFIKSEWGIMSRPHVGAWRGIMNHKNLFGVTNVFMIIISVFRWHEMKGLVRKGILVLLMGVAGFALVQSESATALVLLVIFIFSMWMVNIAKRVKREWPIVLIFLFGLAAVGLFLLFTEFETIVTLLGRDPTLTGRVPLWELLISIAMRRPVLGYGYRTFWMGYASPSGEVWNALIWNPQHAHNGFLNLWLELGLIGLVLVILLFVDLFKKSLVNTLITAQGQYERHNYYIFLLTVMFIFYNLTETIVLQSGLKAYFWVLISYIYIYIQVEGKRIRMIRESSQGKIM